MVMKCPKCESDDIRYSNRHGGDTILRYVFPWIPFRCKECFARFWKFQNPLKSLVSKVVASTLILALAGICLAIWYNDRQEIELKIIPAEKIKLPVESKKEGKIVVNAPVSISPIESEKEQVVVLSGSVPDTAGNKSPEIRIDKTTVEPVSVDQTNVVPETKKAAIINGKLPDAVESHRDKNRGKPSEESRSLYAMTPSVDKMKFQLTLEADAPIQTEKVFFVKSPPPRLVVDIPGKWKYSGEDTQIVKANFVKRIKVGKHPDFLRIVFELDSSDGISQELSESPNGCTITLKK